MVKIYAKLDSSLTLRMTFFDIVSSRTLNSPTAKKTESGINNNTNTKSNLEADIEKELNQLDKDISAGSKESINDNDFNL